MKNRKGYTFATSGNDGWLIVCLYSSNLTFKNQYRYIIKRLYEK